MGREFESRYAWIPNENVTQPDGFFISQNSAFGVELKLASTSWPEQIAKYVALMVWEEMKTHRRTHLGLLFIVPESAIEKHWSKVGLNGPAITGNFLDALDQKKLPDAIGRLFDHHKDHVVAVLEKLKLQVISWATFREEIGKIQNELDGTRLGDQTLNRLLAGLGAQIDAHEGTGIPKRAAS